uniref:Mitochondrial uncoupling protein 3 n=1 Tax=Aegilops tauschii TaxID=37682 RepID=N1QWJ4_AEGTA
MATASSFAAVFISSAIASCFAEVCTIPLDTAKVRLQLQKKTAAGPAGTVGMLGTMMSIAREEGVTALWKGIIPGFHRQCLYGGLRVGLYEPVKALFVFVGDATLMNKILAALTTGVIAIAVANPTDLVKVRLQADGKSTAVKRHYSGALNAYATIVRQMFLGLPGFTDNVYTHLLAGLGAGVHWLEGPVDDYSGGAAWHLTCRQQWVSAMDACRMVALSGVVVASTAVGLGKAYALIFPEDGTVEDGGGGLFRVC